MSALHDISNLFTPMQVDAATVCLPNGSGWFYLTFCPAAPQLAKFIVQACNNHAALVDGLQIALDLIQQLEGMDNRAEPATDVSQLRELLAKVQA
jgi:hypothetical protein